MIDGVEGLVGVLLVREAVLGVRVNLGNVANLHGCFLLNLLEVPFGGHLIVAMLYGVGRLLVHSSQERLELIEKDDAVFFHSCEVTVGVFPFKAVLKL